MQSIPALAALVPRALLLDGDAYCEWEKSPGAAREGTAWLLALGAALGLADAVAALGRWVAAPDVVQVQRILARELVALPLLWRLGADGWLASLAGWPLLGALARWWQPAPPLVLLRLVVTPTALWLEWAGFGLLAHAMARRLGGQGSLGPTLHCLALAEAPRLLLLVPVPLGVAGLGAWLWVLAARFQALRVAHHLDGWRALWTSLLAALFLAAPLTAFLLAVALLARGAG